MNQPETPHHGDGMLPEPNYSQESADYRAQFGPPPMCPSTRPGTDVPCVFLDRADQHHNSHQDAAGNRWAGTGDDLLRWTRGRPVGQHGPGARRPHPDEPLLIPMALPPEPPPEEDDEPVEPLCPATNPRTGLPCVLADRSDIHRHYGGGRHMDGTGNRWEGDGEDFLRWVRQPLDVDESAPPPMTDPELETWLRIARERAHAEAIGHVVRSAPYQFIDGPWPERSGDRSPERSPLMTEAIRRSRSHFEAIKDHREPIRVAHIDAPLVGCAYCIEPERAEPAIAALRSLRPGDRVLPHEALYILAVDDLVKAGREQGRRS